MNNSASTPIIGIDRGASFTDFGVIEHNDLIETLSIEKRDWKNIEKVYNHLIGRYHIHQTVFTGSVTDMPAALKRQLHIIPEIDAIGFGGAALADCSKCIVVSMGTGSAIVQFSNNSAKHVGGSGVGGGTIKGLASLICGLDDPVQIEALAKKGNASKLNLTIADLGYKELSFLGSDVTASNFADLKSKNVEDLAAAILRLVGETVGIIASICAREHNCREHIVMVGKVSSNQFIQNVLNMVGKLYQTRFLFPQNPGHATVYGAALKYFFDQSNSGASLKLGQNGPVFNMKSKNPPKKK
jgi:type II pantothenate kinase